MILSSQDKASKQDSISYNSGGPMSFVKCKDSVYSPSFRKTVIVPVPGETMQGRRSVL